MRWSLVAGVLLVAACGRYEFEHRPEPHTRVLECGAPARFSIGAELESVNAVATPAGFAIVGVDGARALRGWTYDWTWSALAPRTEDLSLGADVTTTTGMVLDDEGIVVASIYGGAMPIGTRLHALGADLSSRTPASSLVGVMAGESPIARGGGDASEIALVSVDPMTALVTARRIDMQGGAGLAPPRTVVETAEAAGSVRLASAKDGYALSWTSAAGSPNRNRVARLDRDLGLVAGPVSVQSGANEPAGRSSVAWLPEADRYLVAWYEKAGAGDDVWYQILDGGLAPVTPARRLAADGVLPLIATDGEQFFVAWRNIGVRPRVLSAAVIAPDGTVTPREVPSSGGESRSHTFVERNGQIVLVWSEAGGDGPDLWLDPMCP